MTSQVTIGVPVYHGENYLEEAVDSILSQTHQDWHVIFSVDGPDPVCEALCRQYLVDPRFRLAVQPERLGWVRNIAWLQQQADGEFWYYHQQDDLVDPTYLEVLIDHARRWPSRRRSSTATWRHLAGREIRFETSVVGSPIARQLSLLTDHFAGVPFRGLTRVAALHATGGGLTPNTVEDFAAETVWSSTMATWGELIQVPVTLYRKRYHDQNAHSSWLEWDHGHRKVAWIIHCHDMLEVAMHVPMRGSEPWLVWMATLVRLTASRATPYLPWDDLTRADLIELIDDLLALVRRQARIRLPSLLEATWEEMRQRSLEFGAPFDQVLTAPSDAA